jgi:hypothetical protein
MNDVLARAYTEEAASAWDFASQEHDVTDYLPPRKLPLALTQQATFEYFAIEVCDVLPRDKLSYYVREHSYTDADWQLFQSLCRAWRRERGVTSSIDEMAMCPSYQHIIGLGERAVPMILKQLSLEEGDPDHWDWALSAISRANPVPDEDRGDTRKMAQAWFRCARGRYVW